MNDGTGPEFILFAGGEVDHDEDGRELVRHLPRFRVFSLTPMPKVAPRSSYGPERADTWKFPADVQSCVALVLDLAHRMRCRVRVVDVYRPGEDAALVRRWVTSETLLPILVSPGGRTLEGADSFVPGTVREFLRGEGPEGDPGNPGQPRQL